MKTNELFTFHWPASTPTHHLNMILEGGKKWQNKKDAKHTICSAVSSFKHIDTEYRVQEALNFDKGKKLPNTFPMFYPIF